MKTLGTIIALAAIAMAKGIVAFKPLTATQRNLAYQIMATWENENYDSSSKSWGLAYDYCEDIDDGQGITIGFTGFTTNGGDAMNMIQNYHSIKAANPFAKVSSLSKCLKSSEGKSNVACFKCKDKSCHSSTLCKAAKFAYTKDKKNYMKAQQDQDAGDNWKTSQALAKKYNILLPLSQAFIYDSCVNHACDYSGNDVEDKIIKHAVKGGKVGSSDSAQKAFFQALLKTRKAYMCGSGCDCCSDADWRIPGWNWLATKGYWNLPNPMSIKTFQDGGSAREYIFKCNPNQHPGCGGGSGGGGGGDGGGGGGGGGGKGHHKGGKKGGKGHRKHKHHHRRHGGHRKNSNTLDAVNATLIA